MEEDTDELQNQSGEPRPSVLVGDGKALRTIVLLVLFLLVVVAVALVIKVAVPLAQKAAVVWKEREAREAQERTVTYETREITGEAAPVESADWLANYSEIPDASPDLVERPSPLGNPGNWVTNDDYPPEARRSMQEGVVGFTLAIGPDGHVAGCKITASSGHRILDTSVCTMLTARGQFHPALDDEQRPVTGHWSSRFRWVLER